MTRVVLPVRLAVAKPMAPTKKLQGTAFTAIPAMLLPSIGLPETWDMASRTSTPDRMTNPGMNRAQPKPMTACL